MKKYIGIVESSTPPPTQYVWLYQGEFKYFSNGQWVEIKNRVISNDTEEGYSVVTPVIKLGNTGEDKKNNLKVCSDIGNDTVISIDVEGVLYGIKYDAIGIYHNGTVSLLEGNHCTVFDINFNTGEVTLDSKYDTSKFLPYIELEIGNSEEVKAYNLEKLQLGHFFVAIDYGYGVGTWNPSNGGKAQIVTAHGHTVYYNITSTGIVAKESESIDIYYDYKNKGGLRNPEDFINKLISVLE